MKINYVFENGNSVAAGSCVQVISTQQTITLTIDAMSRVGMDDLKELIQSKYKVRSVEEESLTCVCKGGK